MGYKIRIYDNGGKTIDRYTLVVPSVNEPGKVDMYGFNGAPFNPLGFGQFAGSYAPMKSYSHLGKLISLDELPPDAQKYVTQTITVPLPDGYGLPLPERWAKKGKKRTHGASRTQRRSPKSTQVGGIR